tara:strand:- start:492 stop:725 length:234 start_codon:yes stop_codon:yes gene_type:complete
MKDYNDKEVNSMILFLRVNNIAQIQYIDKDAVDRNGKSHDSGDYIFYDYMSNSTITKIQLIASAVESGWIAGWVFQK